MTIIRIFYILLFFHLQLTSVMGQSELFLRNKRNENKVKKINLEREFEIKTNDTTYIATIIGFTDSTILIPTRQRTDKDTVYIHTYTYKRYSKSTFFQIGEARDTTVVNKTVVPLYRPDTTEIHFSNIVMMRKDWFKSRRWLEPFGWIAVGSILGVALLPVAAIDEGKDGVREWAQFEAIQLGVALPPIFIGTRRSKYDLNKKWTLETK
jgi:hypothetical protein